MNKILKIFILLTTLIHMTAFAGRMEEAKKRAKERRDNIRIENITFAKELKNWELLEECKELNYHGGTLKRKVCREYNGIATYLTDMDEITLLNTDKILCGSSLVSALTTFENNVGRILIVDNSEDLYDGNYKTLKSIQNRFTIQFENEQVCHETMFKIKTLDFESLKLKLNFESKEFQILELN